MFEFKPGRPKQGLSVSFSDFLKTVSDTNKPTGAKSVGGNVIKVFMSGEYDYYFHSSKRLVTWLNKQGFEV